MLVMSEIGEMGTSVTTFIEGVLLRMLFLNRRFIRLLDPSFSSRYFFIPIILLYVSFQLMIVIPQGKQSSL